SQPGLDHLRANVVKLLHRRLMDKLSPQGAQTPHIAGWGGAAVCCGLAALIFQLRENSRLRILLIAFLLSMAGVFSLVLPDPWFLRFVLFFPALPAIAAARLGSRVRPVRWIAAAGALISVMSTMSPVEMPIAGVSDLVRQSWRTRVSIPLGGLPDPGRSIAWVGGPRANFYLLYGPDFSRKLLYPQAESAEDLLAVLSLESVTTLYGSSSNLSLRGACERGWVRRTIGSFYEVVPDLSTRRPTLFTEVRSAMSPPGRGVAPGLEEAPPSMDRLVERPATR
ncbi:MAG TPA: hypothetical protein VG457_00075, partial [Planctomycetota bacterium]|nr:hypothetical protein [Planctomycetota bacterium]